MKLNLCILFILSFVISSAAQREHPSTPSTTGGPLLFEQAVFDVSSYDVAVTADPKAKSISGTTKMTAKTVIPTNVILLDLDRQYKVTRVEDKNGTPYKYERTPTQIRIFFPTTKQVGEEINTVISYSGVPRIAPNPPWVGGFIWTKTPSGADWISIAMQNDGSDLLFPSKDHPSDKADEVTMRITVPDPLVAVGPGKLENTVKNDNDTSTFTWKMTNPIPNYSILFDAAPYRVIKDSVKSITGETIPIEFYILPESFDKGPKFIEETKKYNAFFEKYIGPFPFRSQKLGIVETPHLGMEHSTHIAYGNKFAYNEHGFDWLMVHEFGHEWWANLVTASDWRDFWIHEGFQSFMDTLYLEHLGKKDAYLNAMRGRARGTLNLQAVAPREPLEATKVYLLAPDYVRSNGDIYGKGAVVLHTLRHLIGDSAFFRALRRMSYPTKEMESLTDGRQTRLVNTGDFLTIAEEESLMDLDWFFEVYLRQPKLPRLATEIFEIDAASGKKLMFLRWDTPNGLPFPMPINVVTNGNQQRVEMKDGKATIPFTGDLPVIDPDGWVLRAR